MDSFLRAGAQSDLADAQRWGPLRLVLGTMTFGDTIDRTGAARLVDAALDAGIMSFDTANCYSAGAAEEFLGELLGSRTHKLKVATKVGIPLPEEEAAPLAPAAVRRSVEASLRRLRLERIDLLYLHQPDRRTPVEETIGALNELVDAGLVGSFGVSNYAAWQIAELARISEVQGLARPSAAQQLYNLLARRIEDEYLEYAQSAGLSTVAYNPLAGGLLTGRYSDAIEPGVGRFGTSRLAPLYRDRYWKPEVLQAVSAFADVARQASLVPAELALRWLFSRPGVDAVVIGVSSPEHLETARSAAAAGPLDAALLEACDQISAPLRGSMPAYNR